MINSPYKFLDFYSDSPDDQRIFFGREREINILVADVVVNRLVVLFARTGTGKTSLINAGVRPRLEARDFRTFYIRVEQDPTDAARDVLQTEGLLKENGGNTPLSAQLSSVVASLEKPIVLFFDQFEEFFIQISNRDTRRNFVSDISEVYRNTESGVHLVFSMREEYFHEMDEFRSEIPSIFHKNSNLRLQPLDADQAKMAIIAPASARGVEVEPVLADVIITDLSQEGGIRPTILQIICDTLWRNEMRHDDKITLGEYKQLGGWRSILDQRLEQDIRNALVDTNHLALMQRLIPQLRTERNTKYPRVFSDLVQTLNTDQESLRELITRLKEIHVVREITVSGANAVEWASDYLAEQTLDLLNLVKGIELRRLLQVSMSKAADARTDLKETQPASDSQRKKMLTPDILESLFLRLEDFQQFSQYSSYLTDLGEIEITFLLDAALFHQADMRLWFNLLSQKNASSLDSLRIKILDRESHINLKLGIVNLLAHLGSEQSIALLEEVLAESDVVFEALDALVGIEADQATQVLTRALARDDLWEAVLITLTRAGTEKAVNLLTPLLQDETRFFQVLSALEPIAKLSTDAGALTGKALESNIPVLVSLLQQENNFLQAFNALERQAKFSGEVGNRAIKALESAIPDLESMLSIESRSTQARSALERLTRFGDPLKSMAENTLRQSTTPPTWEQGISERNLGEKIESFISEDRVEQPAEKISHDTSENFDFVESILPFIMDGTVVPIISNSFRMEQIFRDEKEFTSPYEEQTKFVDEKRTISKEITKAWARNMNYPFGDDHNLAQVAQYYGIEHGDPEMAKRSYIIFLNNLLLKLTEDDPAYREKAKELRIRPRNIRFSEVVQWLDYPRFPEGVNDPLRLLARLPLPVYVTTSYHDFLERALEAEDRSPRTQLCLWSQKRSGIKPELLPDRDFNPSASKPAVYHLYGLEDYASSMVLGEDDYINFLVDIKEFSTSSDLLPSPLRFALSESRLILLGYDQHDWEFRGLFKFINNFRRTNFSPPPAISVQMKPILYNKEIESISLLYSERYLETYRFRIHWNSSEGFINNLWEAWSKYSQGYE